jgi:glycosyltransferase involved in cell wall biosynthesis
MRITNILFNYKKSSGDIHIAGVEKVFVDYNKLLIEAGHQVLSIIKPKMIYKSNLIECGSEVLEVNAVGHADVFSMAKIMFYILKFKPDVIICHSGRAMFMAKAASIFSKIPIVAVNHGSNTNKFLSADYVFNVNSHFNQEIIDLGKDAATAFIVPNMLDVPKNFSPRVNKIWHQPFRIGSLGRLSGEKAYRLAIKALRILKDRDIEVEFYIGGVGPKLEYLQNLATELKVENQVKFLGWVKDKESFFKEIDAFILPSKFETFGIVLLEAMLYKVPIITSDSWGPRDIIEDGVDGLLFSRDNEEEMPELMADMVEKLMKNKDYADKLADNAYKKFHQKYSTEVVSKQIESLLEHIVKSKKNER